MIHTHLDAYTTDQLIFNWKEEEPVEFDEELELPQFKMDGYRMLNNCQKDYKTGMYVWYLFFFMKQLLLTIGMSQGSVHWKSWTGGFLKYKAQKQR